MISELTLNDDFVNVSLPVPVVRLFDMILCTDWYDGITAGIVARSEGQKALRLKILAWDNTQWQRVFLLSAMDFRSFEKIVELLAGVSAPSWPMWVPEWPPEIPENEGLRANVESWLRLAGDPMYVIASDADFDTILASRKLDAAARQRLPSISTGLPEGDFVYWSQYVGTSGKLMGGVENAG